MFWSNIIVISKKPTSDEIYDVMKMNLDARQHGFCAESPKLSKSHEDFQKVHELGDMANFIKLKTQIRYCDLLLNFLEL